MKFIIPLLLTIVFLLVYINTENKNSIEGFESEPSDGPSGTEQASEPAEPEQASEQEGGEPAEPEQASEQEGGEPEQASEPAGTEQASEPAEAEPSDGPAEAQHSPNPSESDTTSSNNLSDTHINTPMLRQKIKSIIENLLGEQESITFKQNEDNYSIKLSEFSFSKLTNHQKSVLEKKIKEHFNSHFKSIYKKTRIKDFDIDYNRINVIIVPGSTMIIVGITPKKYDNMYISEENKELLEFYNFMNILNYGNMPVSERQYLNTNMFDILS